MDKSSKRSVRLQMAAFSSVLTVGLGVFVWIMLGAGKGASSSVLLVGLILFVGVTVAAQIIYALKGQIFEFDGRLAEREVLFAIICFQMILQFSFGFSLYAVNQTELQNTGIDKAYELFVGLQQQADGNSLADYRAIDLQASMPEHIEAVFVAENYSDNAEYSTKQYYRFPVDGGGVVMQKSRAYFTKNLQDFAVSLLMSLVVSVLLMAELVLLATKFIGRQKIPEPETSTPVPLVTGYLRQIAFLFYFTGFLGASFIPIMARDLAGSSSNADFIAGLPYSVEALAGIAAILITTRIFGKKGWKPPYIMGAVIFIVGLAASALSPNLAAFILSRGMVGMGYGLCWMTLRNITTLAADRTRSFAGLNSGIYAGIMCGVAFGAVLADIVGFKAVLLISGLMAALSALFPLVLGNAKSGAFNVSGGGKINLTWRDIAVFTLFLVLIVIPTSIADAFNGFLLPIYVNDLGLPTAYVGRVSLVYNLCLVYLSSTLLLSVVCRYIKKPLFQNALHLAIISGALFIIAYFGGFTAVLIAGAMLGAVDGFGFSLQNSHILDMRLSEKIGITRMLTLFSLFKKLCAMIAPFAFGLFLLNGFSGLGAMAAVFVICGVTAVISITLLNKVNKGAKQFENRSD
ncbi:MAG: MFS transporter [Oscillospiraceae bacterium]|nr:MFS transporter [Oscillospiraceae bacterium]